jgi:nucleotide-binding universal stress UspA family protein
LAQEYGARLTVLHVVEDVRACTEEEEERIREVNLHETSRFMPPESESWCNVKFRVAFGSAVEEIIDAASETKANLIIMGTQTRKTFAGLMPLTIAYNVAAKAECPVLTVRGGSA